MFLVHATQVLGLLLRYTRETLYFFFIMTAFKDILGNIDLDTHLTFAKQSSDIFLLTLRNLFMLAHSTYIQSSSSVVCALSL
jgi:hypothetical protein